MKVVLQRVSQASVTIDSKIVADIQTGLHYPMPLHLQPAYSHLRHRVGDFQVSEWVARECLSLPLFPEMTDEQQDAVVAALANALKEIG